MNAVRWASGGLMFLTSLIQWRLDLPIEHALFTQFGFAIYVLADAAGRSSEGK